MSPAYGAFIKTRSFMLGVNYRPDIYLQVKTVDIQVFNANITTALLQLLTVSIKTKVPV